MNCASAIVCLACALAIPAATAPRSFDATGYQLLEGELLLNRDGRYIEPYFATKALIVAGNAGLSVADISKEWIRWLLPRQKRDGRFERYCRKGQQWHSCGHADADDAMLALWLELLYRTAPDEGLPEEWKPSANLAWKHLEQLQDRRHGVYRVSGHNNAELFMDNVEVWEAFDAMARQARRFGDSEQGRQFNTRANALQIAIRKQFWDPKATRFRSSSQRTKPSFYPDVVGQTYPWLSGMPTNRHAERDWQEWKSRFASDWLENRYDSHAWGLIALTALRLGDNETAECWASHAATLRNTAAWNILEEASFQAVEANLTAAENRRHAGTAAEQ